MPANTEAGKEELRLTVVVPTYNRWQKARVALAHLSKSEYGNFEVVLVEDGCTDGTVENCRAEFPEVKILHGDGDLWWSGACNLGVEYALGREADAVVLINDDNNVEPQTIGSLVESFRRKGSESVICARIRLVDSDAPEWRGNPPPWHPEFQAWQPPDIDRIDELPIQHPPGGQGVLIPAECFRRVGLFDRRNLPMHWADHNFHYRAMKAGYKYFIATKAVIWNVPNETPPQLRDIFTLRGAWWFLTNPRSYGNMKTLRTHLKLSLPPGEYRRTFYPILGRHLAWLAYGWLQRKPLLHRPLRILKRSVFPNKGQTASTQ